MSAKHFKLLTLTTAIALLLTAAVLFMNRGPAPLEGTGEKLFPALSDSIGEAIRIELVSGPNTVTLTKKENIWAVEEKTGYRADQNKVLTFLRNLSRSEKVEPKTRNPVLYDRIGLGGETTQLTVKAADTALASLKIGNSQYDGAAKENHTFVLLEDSPQTWLVSGLDEATTDPLDWLDRDILRLERKRIARIEVSHDNGENYTVHREGPEVYNFSLEGLAEGETAKTSPLNSMAGALQFIGFEDVANIADMSFTEPVTLIFHTFDGLSVRIVVAKSGDDRWAYLTASHDPAIAEQGSSPEVMEGAPADGAAEAADLNRRWNGWAYKITGLKADDLTRKRADMVDIQSDEEETETE